MKCWSSNPSNMAVKRDAPKAARPLIASASDEATRNILHALATRPGPNNAG